MNSSPSTSDITDPGPKKSPRWLPILVILGVLGGGFVLFMLFIVLPAVLFLSEEESPHTWSAEPVRAHQQPREAAAHREVEPGDGADCSKDESDHGAD